MAFRVPQPGDVVMYALSPYDVEVAKHRIADPHVIGGVAPIVGDTLPMIVTGVGGELPPENSVLDGQVVMSGNFTIYVSSVPMLEGLAPGTCWPREERKP